MSKTGRAVVYDKPNAPFEVREYPVRDVRAGEERGEEKVAHHRGVPFLFGPRAGPDRRREPVDRYGRRPGVAQEMQDGPRRGMGGGEGAAARRAERLAAISRSCALTDFCDF